MDGSALFCGGLLGGAVVPRKDTVLQNYAVSPCPDQEQVAKSLVLTRAVRGRVAIGIMVDKAGCATVPSIHAVALSSVRHLSCVQVSHAWLHTLTRDGLAGWGVTRHDAGRRVSGLAR
jgi:hypothetical protein